MEFENASIHGQTFVYSDTGEGPPVVLWHGFPDTPGGWERTARTLNEAGYRTIVPYLRGYHPDTLVPGRRYGGAEIGEDALRLLDALELERAAIVGHDWGASVVYRLAASSPLRVRGVCAVAIPHPDLLGRSPALLWAGRHILALKLPTGAWLARRRDFAYLDTLMRRWSPNWFGAERDASLAEIKRLFADRRVFDAALSYYRHLSPTDTVGRIAVPGLLVGTTGIAPDLFRRSPELFDAPCEVVIAEGAGHWPQREAPELFEERLLAWLGGLPR
jgi:pimeloyl-ACP methyl ester carboxylesterase